MFRQDGLLSKKLYIYLAKIMHFYIIYKNLLTCSFYITNNGLFTSFCAFVFSLLTKTNPSF